MKSSVIMSTVVLSAMFSASTAEAADPARGKQFYTVCTACHGESGAGSKELHSPRIAGLSDWYLARQLQNFKTGARGADPKDEYGAQMRPMAMTLVDDKAVADVVAYIGTLNATKPPATISGDPAKGKAAYAVCAACHGANAEGNTALNAPRLAGQSDWYLVHELKAFKSGLRGAHPQDTFGAQMRPMALTLADDNAIHDVIAYINTLGN